MSRLLDRHLNVHIERFLRYADATTVKFLWRCIMRLFLLSSPQNDECPEREDEKDAEGEADSEAELHGLG